MWVLPTLNRPGRCQETLDSIIVAGVATPGLVLVDGSDPDPAYRSLRLPPGWSIEIAGVSRGMLGTLNHAFATHPNEPWYGLLNDDFIVRTIGWDVALVKAAGRRGISISNDGWQGGRTAMGGGAMVFGGDFLRALGYWAPPGLWHTYADNIWKIIADAGKIWTYVPNVMVEHRHHFNKKAVEDSTYRLGYSRVASDAKVFEAFCKNDLPKAIERVRALFVPEIENIRQRIEYARTRKVLIAVACGRELHPWQFSISLYRTGIELQKLGIRQGIETIAGSSNLPRVRNELVAKFLAMDFDDILLVDDDMVWEPEAVLRLISSPQPFIGAVGRKRVDTRIDDVNGWCADFLPDSERGLTLDAQGSVEVQRVGTGFLKLSRVVFEKLMAANPDWKRSGRDDMAPKMRDNYFDFFAYAQDQEIGEDGVFCDRWRGEGGHIFVDPTIKLGHVGSKVYEGTVSDLMMSPIDAEIVEWAA